MFSHRSDDDNEGDKNDDNGDIMTLNCFGDKDKKIKMASEHEVDFWKKFDRLKFYK